MNGDGVTEVHSILGIRARDIIARRYPEAIISSEEDCNECTIYIKKEFLVSVCVELRDNPEALYTLPLFVTAVDFESKKSERPRFDVVYMLSSITFNDSCRLIVQVDEEDPTVPSIESVYAGMDWLERETFDLFGIWFEGHHDLRRILLPDDWEGHPLRKDYKSFGEPIAFTHNLEWALPATERPADMPGSTGP